MMPIALISCRVRAYDESDAMREVALAVVEFHREFKDHVATVDRGENLDFDLLENCVI